eukprot:7351020-Alexandrium_andersonii.AAC.1
MGHTGSKGREAVRNASRHWGRRRCPQPAGQFTHMSPRSLRQTGQGSHARVGWARVGPEVLERGALAPSTAARSHAPAPDRRRASCTARIHAPAGRGQWAAPPVANCPKAEMPTAVSQLPNSRKGSATMPAEARAG